jgi:hypothetical protein
MIRVLPLAAILILSSCNEREEKTDIPKAIGGRFESDGIYRPKVATPIVIVSDATPDPYKHPTTHPESLFEELGLEGIHGDGVTLVNFVGKVVCVTNDGNLQPVSEVKFFRLDDYFRSGDTQRELLPFTTATNGDFMASLEIFAASAHRKGGERHDSPIYQTGTAIIEAVAEGFENQRINVRFEQPSTLIVLKRKQ